MRTLASILSCWIAEMAGVGRSARPPCPWAAALWGCAEYGVARWVDLAYDRSMTHDERCENRPGGTYYGLTATDGLPIPCHCAAREAGREAARRKLARRKG